MTGLEAKANNQDARAGRVGAGGAATVQLLGHGGRTATHELGGTLEDGQLRVVGEQVEWVDWDAVSANSETWAEG